MEGRDFIDQHMLENLSLNQICEEIGLSKYYFIRMFKSVFGFLPHHYQVHKRLTYAKDELKSGRSISETALVSGYADIPAFNKAFTKKWGKTPGNFKISNF